jgi:hypothetical protein
MDELPVAQATHEPMRPAPARHSFAADPDERLAPVLSVEPPPRKSPKVARGLAIAKKMCMAVVAAVLAVILLAFIADRPDQPVRAPTQSPSMRG